MEQPYNIMVTTRYKHSIDIGVFFNNYVSELSEDVDKPQFLKDESELATQTDMKMWEAKLDCLSIRSMSPTPSLASGSSEVSLSSTSCLGAAALDSIMDSSGFLTCMDSSAELSIGGTGWPSQMFLTCYFVQKQDWIIIYHAVNKMSYDMYLKAGKSPLT